MVNIGSVYSISKGWPISTNVDAKTFSTLSDDFIPSRNLNSTLTFKLHAIAPRQMSEMFAH